MKGIIALVFVIFLSLRLQGQERFELLWKEDFDSSQIDYSRWGDSYRWGRNLVMNHELQYYTDGRNFELKSGVLNIIAKKEKTRALVDSSLAPYKLLADSAPNLRDFSFTSGMLRTKQQFTYGKFEIRCELPVGKGGWPAFWLFGDCGEIDFFEKPARIRYAVTNNIHYTSGKEQLEDFKFVNMPGKADVSKKFHTYSFEWKPDTLQWLIDGEIVMRRIHAFNCPMELFINLAIADNAFWGYAPKRKKWQGTFAIDYIKVWRLK